MVDEPAEIFDDMYLGLRAGPPGARSAAASRFPPTSRRRSDGGERLSTWRKSLAVGSFAVGTSASASRSADFVFGRWRKA